MANANRVTTSIVVEFDSGGADGILSAEIDSREDGYNSGDTSFSPGDQPVILVFKSDNVAIDAMDVSAGELVSLGSGTLETTEILTFANVREAGFAKPVASGFTSKWLGRNGGAITRTQTKVKVPADTVAALKATYTSDFTAYRLINVPVVLDGETSYSVVIYISGAYT